MSIRQILRTNRGNLLPLNTPDTLVYIRRLRYTPYTPQVMSDAVRCVSLASCYGTMPPAPMGVANLYVSVNTAGSGAPSGRRSLLQQTAANGAAIASALASSVPGVPAENITSTPSAFGLSFSVVIFGLDNAQNGGDSMYAFQSQGLQAPLIGGLASDVIPDVENIIVQSVTEDVTGTMLTVQVLVSGYANAAEVQSDYLSMLNGGASVLSATASALNNAVGAISTPYITTGSVNSLNPDYAPQPTGNTYSAAALLADDTKCPSYPDDWDATCVDGGGNAPSVWCAECVTMDLTGLSVVTTYTISVPAAATAVDTMEASLNAALNSGALASALTSPSRRHLLQSSGSMNVSSTNNLVMQRLITNSPTTLACERADVQKEEWENVGMAFVIAFGVQSIALVALAVNHAMLVKQTKQSRAASAKIGATGLTESEA